MPGKTLLDRLNNTPRSSRGRPRSRVNNRPNTIVYNMAPSRRGPRYNRQNGNNKAQVKGPRSAQKVPIQKRNQRVANNKKLDSQLGSAKPLTVSNKILFDADINSFTLMIEAQMATLFMRSDLAAIGPTYLWYLYFYHIFFMYIRKYGQLTGAMKSYVPELTGSEISVPFAIAKYLEYLGEYKSGHTASTTYQFQTDFNFPTTSVIGTPSSSLVSRVGGVNWLFFTLKETQVTEYPAYGHSTSITVPGNPTYTNVGGNWPQTYAQFADDPKTISILSSALLTVCDCISACNIPGEAPDASAYTMPNLAYAGGIVPISGITPLVFYGYDFNFNPEVACLYSTNRTPASDLGFGHSKSMPLPLSVNPTQTFYSTIQNTIVYLGLSQYSRRYSTGTFNVSLPFAGQHPVSTFYRRYQNVSFNAYSQMTAALYLNLMNNKSGGTQTGGLEDANGEYMWYLHAISHYTAQYQFNLHNMDNTYIPLLNINGSNQYFPQIAYTDNSWATTVLSPLIADCIGMWAPVMEAGAIRSPTTDFTNSTYAASSPNVPGPIGWSVYGWTPAQLAVYAYPNIYDTILGSVAAQPVPNVKALDVGNGYVLYNSDYLDHMTGLYTADDIQYVTPYVPNGAYAQFIITQVDQFWKLRQTVNQAPRTPVPQYKIGSPDIMINVVEVPNEASLNNALQSDLLTPAVIGTDLNAGIQGATTNVEAVDAKLPRSETEVLLTGLANVSSNLEQDPTNTLNRTHRRRQVAAAHARISFAGDSTNESPTAHPLLVDPNVGQGWFGVVQNVMQRFTDPNSPFASQLMKLNSTGNSNGLHKLIMDELRPVAKNVFKSNVRPSASSSVLPSSLANLPINQIPRVTGFLNTQGFVAKGVTNVSKPGKSHKFFKFIKDATVGTYKAAKWTYNAGKTAAETGAKIAKTLETVGQVVSTLA